MTGAPSAEALHFVGLFVYGILIPVFGFEPKGGV